MRTTPLLALSCSLVACVTAPGADDESIDGGKDDRPTAQSGFTYDARTGQCRNARGTTGLNRFVSVDTARACTDFRGKSLVYVTLRDKDLRGSVFGNNQTYGGSLYLEGSDVRGGRFEALMPGQGFVAENVDLRGANLAAVDVSYRYDGGVDTTIVLLRGALFNATTKLPLAKGVRITPQQAIELYGMVETE